jgi:FemAB-related protein (PEP-CTERM system-associated)
MIIRPYRQIDTDMWNDYVHNHPEGTVFHLTNWKNVIEASFHHKSIYLIAEQDNSIEGIFPLFEMNSFLFGHYLVSVPFAELGGVLADNEAIERALVDRAITIIKKKNARYLEIRNRNEMSIPGLKTKSLYYNFRKEISPDSEKNLKAIPRKARAMVRKALKNSLQSLTGHSLIDPFYRILSINYHRLGTPIFSKRFFRNFLNQFQSNANILVVTTKEGKPAAAVFFFLFKDQIIPYYAGSDFSLRSLGPNDFMYWELMRYGAEKGCRIFDYGRSKIGTGSFDFKRHWGFEPSPLAYQYQLVNAKELPNLSPGNPEYKKKIEMWKRLPLGITKIIGPIISRNLA